MFRHGLHHSLCNIIHGSCKISNTSFFFLHCLPQIRNIYGNFDKSCVCCLGNQLKWHNGVRLVDDVYCSMYNSRNQKGITNSWDVSFKKRLPCQTTHNKTKPPPIYYVCLPSSSSTKKALKMCRRFFYSDATLGQSWKRGGSILAIISGFG